MPIVDISGFGVYSIDTKKRIRKHIQEFYHRRLGVPLTATTVTFITDESEADERSRHVMARLYSKLFTDMPQDERNEVSDGVVAILEQQGGHDFNEAFIIPVATMRGGDRPYEPPKG